MRVGLLDFIFINVPTCTTDVRCALGRHADIRKPEP
jgi:hypothetical protein